MVLARRQCAECIFEKRKCEEINEKFQVEIMVLIYTASVLEESYDGIFVSIMCTANCECQRRNFKVKEFFGIWHEEEEGLAKK